MQELVASEPIDSFRLAIRGFALLEDSLDAALGEAFGGELPADLRRTRFGIRVALAEALNLLPEQLKPAIGKLKEIRDAFAHGKIDDLSPSVGKELYAVVHALVPNLDEISPETKAAEPEYVLGDLLLILELLADKAYARARERREHEAQVVREWWDKRRTETRPITRLEIEHFTSREQ
jgi:hypothetical protein